MLAQLHLNRNSEVPLVRQLRAAIKMAIIDGELPDGTALPSVRRLAALLNVAPVTVVQAYRHLQTEELIRAVPKRGYFVSVAPGDVGDGAGSELVQSLLGQAIQTARMMGVSDGGLRRMLEEELVRRRQGAPVVAVVGQRKAALDLRVATVREYLRGIEVTVVGIDFSDLERDSGAPAIDLESIQVFLVSVGEVQRAAALLGANMNRILPMTRTLRPDVRAFIDGLGETQQLGVIAGSEEFAERILVMVYRINSRILPPLIAVAEDVAAVRRVVEEADAVVVGSTAMDDFTALELPERPWVEFISLPDEATLQRLRRRLVNRPIDVTDVDGGGVRVSA